MKIIKLVTNYYDYYYNHRCCRCSASPPFLPRPGNSVGLGVRAVDCRGAVAEALVFFLLNNVNNCMTLSYLHYFLPLLLFPPTLLHEIIIVIVSPDTYLFPSPAVGQKEGMSASTQTHISLYTCIPSSPPFHQQIFLSFSAFSTKKIIVLMWWGWGPRSWWR